MTKKVELIIGDYPNQVSLDLEANAISIALQYSIDDVRNIDKKNSNYSKTITLPGTKKNNKSFGHLFDINTDFTVFNPNLKTSARIVVDSSPVLEGYLQLKNVKKLNNADLQGNKIAYEVIIIDDSVDFIQELGDKKVQDLDVSAHNHTYNQTNIENAWNNHTYLDFYQYPLLDKNTKGYITTDFKPAVYHKAVLLKIAEEVGYSLEGSFLNNTTYEREIIAWDGNTPKITDEDAIQREFEVGYNKGTTTLFTQTKNNYKSLNDVLPESAIDCSDLTGDFFDNTGGYSSDGTFAQWDVVNTGKYDFNIEFKASLEITGKGAMKTLGGDVIGNDSNPLYLRAVLRDGKDGTYLGGQSSLIGGLESLSTTVTETKTFQNDCLISVPQLSLVAGQEVVLHLSFSNGGQEFAWAVGSVNQNVSMVGKIYETLGTGVKSYWANNTVQEENAQDSDEIELNQYLPKDIKQKDILSDIIRRYNVYVRKHPYKTKTLILESRDDFYNSSTTVLDWTQKKDYSSEDKIAFLSDLQNKEILFTYKEANGIAASDNLKYNEAYKASTGDIYGQKLLDFQNDFVKGVKRIESVFSTVPLIYKTKIGNDVIIPALNIKEGKRKPVLLYWGGMKPVQNKVGASTNLGIKWGTALETNYTTYPYAGHYDDPYTPTLDIHFGEVTYEYYGKVLNNSTDNNLFNNYWRNYVNQITDGKIVTSKLYLKETDINFIKDNLNARIFIKDSYYTINKITDYKPLEDGLTTVELLRIEKGTTFQPTTTDLNFSLSSLNTSVNTSPSGPFIASPYNEVSSSNILMLGENNYVGSGSSGIITGNNNTVGGDALNVNVQGNNNIIEDGVSNVVIVGDNQTVTESNVSIINGNVLSEETAERIFTEIEIGDWNMDSTSFSGVSHSLTNWQSIRDVSVVIRNDADNRYYNTPDANLTAYFDSSFFILTRLTGGAYDTATFSTTSYNRGFIRFSYIPS